MRKPTGNIRELSNIVERASMTCEGDVIPKDLLPQEVLREQTKGVREVNNLNKAVEEFEGDLIRQAYKKYGSSIEVGKALGISQPTAYRKIQKYVGK